MHGDYEENFSSRDENRSKLFMSYRSASAATWQKAGNIFLIKFRFCLEAETDEEEAARSRDEQADVRMMNVCLASRRTLDSANNDIVIRAQH